MRSIHPGWCDPRYCRFTDIDVQHRSTPTLLTTCDHEWWFTLARADDWAHPQQYGGTELLDRIPAPPGDPHLHHRIPVSRRAYAAGEITQWRSSSAICGSR